MALDVYVMPIWRFKARDFTSPVQRLIGPDVPSYTVTPSGILTFDRKAARRAIVRWKAKRSVAQLRWAIGCQLGRPVRWDDDGDVVYGEQSSGFSALRAFATWLDRRDQLPTFEPMPDRNYYKHPAFSAGCTRPPTYPQVTGHDCFAGYFLPVEIDRIVQVEPFKSWGNFLFHRSVGSSDRLLAELTELGPILEAIRPVEGERDPLEDVRWAYAHLFEVAQLSCMHRLPIVFHG